MTQVPGAWFEGVYFTEAPLVAERIDEKLLHVEISRQNSNLRAVKKKLADAVRKRGGDALVGFTYGQKSHGVLQQVFTFKWDTESWHGSGYVARLGENGRPEAP